MGEEELDFSEIQKIFTNRETREEERAQNQRSQLKIVKDSRIAQRPKTAPAKTSTTTVIRPTQEGLDYKKVEVRDEPKYDNMDFKNLEFRKRAFELSKIEKLALVTCTVAIVTAIGIMSFVGITNDKPEISDQRPGITTELPGYQQGTTLPGNIVEILNPADCNLSDFTIVLRQSTNNVNKIVSVTERELTELGVDNRVVTDKDNIVEVVSNIKEENPNRDIIVINIDGVANKTLVETVIMTNYSNTTKSADNLALAINNSNNDIYGINSEIRCGKKLSDGSRGATSVESALHEAGHDDVICLTVAPATASIDTDIERNSVASSIVDGIMRFGSLEKDERYTDSIRRVEYGDTIYGLAEKNNVTEAFIRSSNSEVLAANNGILRNDTALLIATVPRNLTSEVSVNNPTITTNPNDITTKVSYYEVDPGDTLSEIAEKLGVSQSDLVVPSGNPNKIFPGDKIGYETEVGKVLVSKTTEKSK